MNSRCFHSRRSFLKTIGVAAAGAPFVTRGLMAQSPNSVLRHASFGAGGMAWENLTKIAACPGVEIVANLRCGSEPHRRCAEAVSAGKIYQDWRELLDKEAKRIDSVSVSTPDHMHAPIGVSAMHLGKHLYGEKPLAHDLYEVRRMAELAANKKLVTQMGVQLHQPAIIARPCALCRTESSARLRRFTLGATRPGAIRPRCRTNRIPCLLASTGICGWASVLSAVHRRRILSSGELAQAARFGTGTFGDMGCHIFDPVFSALKLTASAFNPVGRRRAESMELGD